LLVGTVSKDSLSQKRAPRSALFSWLLKKVSNVLTRLKNMTEQILFVVYENMKIFSFFPKVDQCPLRMFILQSIDKRKYYQTSWYSVVYSWSKNVSTFANRFQKQKSIKLQSLKSLFC